MAPLQMIRVGRSLATLLSASLLVACGGGDDGDEGSSLSGAVTGPWRDYCVATLTTETTVDDGFDPLTLKAGSEYLVADYEDGFGEIELDLLYLTPGGPYDIELRAATAAELPITSNCDLPNARPYYAVFQNLAVYGDEALTTKVCDLAENSVLPRDSSSVAFQNAVSFDFSDEPQIYEVSLNAFGAQCGGKDSGFISVPATQVAGTTTWLPGIHWLLGPS